MGKKVIIAHDDVDLNCLDTAAAGWSVKTAVDGEEALQLIQRFRNAVVAALIDLDSPNEEGLAILRQLRTAYPELPVVALTRSDKPVEAAEALGAGATECAYKPVIHEELVRILQRVTKGETGDGSETSDRETGQSEFVHLNSEMRSIQQALRMLAPWNVPVVFMGETGVGKEVAARELHRLSSRSHKPFIKINCAAVPSELLESELFGYEKGAFTGALRSKPGKFELADGGTLMLDEIGDMHANLQAKLLQVLQDGEFDRLGGRQSVRVDVRVIAATHRDLRRAVETGAFREDLYYRLNVATVVIPPLRDRKDEIIPLAEQFIIKHGKSSGMELPEIPTLLRQVLVDYAWPGNVRELENTIRKFLVFRQPEALAAELWKRMAERRNGSANMTAVKIPLRPTPAVAGAQNGSNGYGNVKTFPHGNSFGPVDPERIPPSSENHTDMGHQEDFFSAVHRPNGKSNGVDFDYAHLGAGRADRPEHFSDSLAAQAGGLPDYDDIDDVDDVPVAGTVKSNGAEMDVKTFKNGEQLSTLAQVEELSKEFERRTILAALQRSTWNRKRAAKMLDIDYKGLLYKMKKLEIA